MIRRLATLVFTLACVSHSQAGIVTFENLVGGPFLSGTEDGFNFTGSSAVVFSSLLPSKWVGVNRPSSTAVLSFTNGGVFTFTSVDIGRIAPDSSLPPVLVAGFRAGNQVGVDTFLPVLAAPGFLFTFTAGNLAGQVLDRLTITFISSRSTSPAIDNVTFGEASLVPEPATLALSGVGILIAVAHARRRRAANA